MWRSFSGGAALALAWGRGERQFRMPGPASQPALVAVPPIQVATPDAYAWWDAQNRSPSSVGPVTLDADALSTWGSIGRLGGKRLRGGRIRNIQSCAHCTSVSRGRGRSGCGCADREAPSRLSIKKERERDDAVQRLGERNQRLIKTTTRSTVSDGPQTCRGIVSMRRSDLAGFVAVVCRSLSQLDGLHDP